MSEAYPLTSCFVYSPEPLWRLLTICILWRDDRLIMKQGNLCFVTRLALFNYCEFLKLCRVCCTSYHLLAILTNQVIRATFRGFPRSLSVLARQRPWKSGQQSHFQSACTSCRWLQTLEPSRTICLWEQLAQNLCSLDIKLSTAQSSSRMLSQRMQRLHWKKRMLPCQIFRYGSPKRLSFHCRK